MKKWKTECWIHYLIVWCYNLTRYYKKELIKITNKQAKKQPGTLQAESKKRERYNCS